MNESLRIVKAKPKSKDSTALSRVGGITLDDSDDHVRSLAFVGYKSLEQMEGKGGNSMALIQVDRSSDELIVGRYVMAMTVDRIRSSEISWGYSTTLRGRLVPESQKWLMP